MSDWADVQLGGIVDFFYNSDWCLDEQVDQADMIVCQWIVTMNYF